MFGDLPKLFDKEFAIGFFLPSVAMVGAIWFILNAYGIEPDLPSLDAWIKTAVAAMIVWLMAVGLLALNYPILELLEGYPKFYPLRRQREHLWKRRFRRKIAPNLALNKQVTEELAAGVPASDVVLPKSFEKNMLIAAERYPDEEDWVLPSDFGNVFRALEVYSRVIYGIEAVTVWPRLQAVIPDNFQKLQREAWSIVNFSVNLTVAGTMTIIVYLALVIWMRRLTALWIPAAAIAIAIGSHRMSLSAVLRYGAYVKSAFDLYRGELAKQLRLKMPASPAKEREMWLHVSKMMAFRLERNADLLAEFRGGDGPVPGD